MLHQFIYITAVIWFMVSDYSGSTCLLFSIMTLSPNYWKQRVEADGDQDTNNPHIHAARIIKRGGPVTSEDINLTLASQGYSITAEELEQLKQIPFNEYSLFDLPRMIAALKNLYPKKPKGAGQWGIYMWINTISSKIYVGSSTVLWERLAHYWKNHKGLTLRKILADIKVTGLQNFNLRVYDFPVHFQELRFLLALEQYYLLSLNPQNNTLYVAGGSPGGEATAERNRELHRQEVFMYEGNTLIYVFSAVTNGPNNVSTILGMKNVADYLGTGALLHGVFTLVRERGEDTVEGLLDKDAMLSRYNEVKSPAVLAHLRTATMKQGILLTRIVDNKEFQFESVSKARTWLISQINNKVHNQSILSAWRKNKPLFGYTVKYLNR